MDLVEKGPEGNIKEIINIFSWNTESLSRFKHICGTLESD